MEFLKDLWMILLAIVGWPLSPETPNAPQQSLAHQEQKTPSENDRSNDARRMFNGALSTKEQGKLFIGIEQGNKNLIVEALKNGADINRPINGLNALAYAIRHGDQEIIEFLTENNAQVTPDHIDQANLKAVMYDSNMNETDIRYYNSQGKQFTQEVSSIIMSDYAKRYLDIAKFLDQKMKATSTHIPTAKAGGGASAKA